MDTTPLNQASVTRIVTLKKGDVYKRLQAKDRYNTDDQMRWGVVTDVLNNGTESAITAVEFAMTYGRLEPQVQVFRAGVDAALFPATPDEVTAALSEVLEVAQRNVEQADRQAATTRAALQFVERVFADQGLLTAPETTTEVSTPPVPSDGPDARPVAK